jgi:predicted porin
MKKTWVALAVAGAFVAGTAQAQSSVTLYGIVDINYMWEERPANVNGTVQQESVSSINSGHQSGSRWGLRGSEDLGGGLKAIFTLEGGYSPDTGTLGQGGRLFGRQAWAGLQGGWGAVVAGRLATFSSGTGSFDMFGRTDPFLTGFGLASLGQTFFSANALRLDNTIAYQSPKFAGFQGGIGYSTNVDGGETVPDGRNNTAIASAINWEAGPFWVSVTYDVVNFGDPVAPSTVQREDQKHLQVGATFDLGPVRLHGGYADQSAISGVPLVSGGTGAFGQLPAGISNFDADAYMLGVTWKIGAFTVMGSYQMFDADSKLTAANVNFEPDFNIWGVGAAYNLSRRTNLYASYATRDADGTLAGNAFNYKQLALGVRHLF